MANTPLDLGKPGIADIQTGSFTGPREYRANDQHATTTSVKVGENVDLPVLSVVYYDEANDTIGLAVHGDASKAAYGILTAPVKTGAGEATTVAVYRTGAFLMDALNWDASFDTDEKKATAFEGGKSPSLFIMKNPNKDEAYI